MKRKAQLKKLRQLLRQLRTHHGALAHFRRRLSRLTGKSLHINFPQRIMNGEIRFERAWYEHLEATVALAEALLENYHRARREYLQKVGVTTIINTKATAEQLFAQVWHINELAEEGAAYPLAFAQMQALATVIDYSKLARVSPYHLAHFQLVNARILLQLGQAEGLHLTEEAITLFEDLEEAQYVRRAYSLRGHFLRQTKAYEEALEVFRLIEGHIFQQAGLQAAERNLLLRHNAHQQGITLMRKGSHEQDAESARAAIPLLYNSELYFAEHASAAWYDHCRIRRAEAHLKAGELQPAETILQQFANMHRLSRLRLPQQVILFRVFAHYHQLAGRKQEASRYLDTAQVLAQREGYTHELERLLRLRGVVEK